MDGSGGYLMRINSTNLRWTSVLLAALIIGVLGGCGEQAQDVDEEMPVITDDLEPDNGDAAADGTPSQDIPDDAETMADVAGSFTMPTSFRMTVEDAQGNTQTMAMKMDGEQATNMRIEHEAPEGAQIMIMDFEGGEMVSYDPSTNEGFNMPVSDEEAADAPMPWEDYDEAAEIVGSEEINGVDTWIVEAAPEGPEGEAATIWIGKEDGLMRQVKQGEETVTFTISDLNSVSDDAFEVPDDVEISEMPAPGPMEGAE
jgi:outer membrane lipoprotein-sorting protein